ncbi:MAG: ABC transporter ATP-binding protein [Acetobacter sp.]|jgi:putative spermidine/putrescine transport system ATP-binding protein
MHQFSVPPAEARLLFPSDRVFPSSPDISALKLRAGETIAFLDLGEMAAVVGGKAIAGRDDGPQPPLPEQIMDAFMRAGTGPEGYGLVTSRLALFPHLTVRENIALPLRAGLPGAEISARVARVLALTGLEAEAGLKPMQLGQERRIRVALARGLVTGASTVVLDYPFRGLDHAERSQLVARIRRLKSSWGFSLVLLTGERDEALLMADRIGVIADGVLLQTGRPDELFDRPVDACVAVGFGDAVLLRGIVIDEENDIVRVRLAAGVVVCATSGGVLRPGILVDVCVRPGRITPVFGAKPDDETATLVGTLASVVQMADVFRLVFRLPDGGEVIVHRPSVLGSRNMRPGSEACLVWQENAAVAFPSAADKG